MPGYVAWYVCFFVLFFYHCRHKTEDCGRLHKKGCTPLCSSGRYPRRLCCPQLWWVVDTYCCHLTRREGKTQGAMYSRCIKIHHSNCRWRINKRVRLNSPPSAVTHLCSRTLLCTLRWWLPGTWFPPSQTCNSDSTGCFCRWRGRREHTRWWSPPTSKQWRPFTFVLIQTSAMPSIMLFNLACQTWRKYTVSKYVIN